jgi:hypothetical protein
VWSIAPESLIVAPAAGAAVARGTELEIWGWAWSDEGVRRVDVRVQDEWQRAKLEPRSGYSWQRFSLRWSPQRVGRCALAACAEAITGERQPAAGRRNAFHEVAVDVS